MQQKRACCIAGPERLPEGVDENRMKQRLEIELLQTITYDGITCFYVGVCPGVCQCAAETVLRLKSVYPAVRLSCVLACETLADGWAEPQRDRFYTMMERCDEEVLLQSAYSEGCESRCIQYMLRRCELLLAVWGQVELDYTGYAVLLARHTGNDIRLISLAES